MWHPSQSLIYSTATGQRLRSWSDYHRPPRQRRRRLGPTDFERDLSRLGRAAARDGLVVVDADFVRRFDRPRRRQRGRRPPQYTPAHFERDLRQRAHWARRTGLTGRDLESWIARRGVARMQRSHASQGSSRTLRRDLRELRELEYWEHRLGWENQPERLFAFLERRKRQQRTRGRRR